MNLQTEIELKSLLLKLVPKDGTAIGNQSLLNEFQESAKSSGITSYKLSESVFWELRERLIGEGKIEKGRGRGGSVYRANLVKRKKTRNNSGSSSTATTSKDGLSKLMFSLVPKDGTNIGNKSLLQKFRDAAIGKGLATYKLKESTYWEIREELIESGKIGKGQGKGGSVYRQTETKEKRPRTNKYRLERELYPVFEKYLRERWVRENNLKKYVLQITASQGKRATGGTWTRPDLALVAVRSYPFVPGKFIDVSTFEVKPAYEYKIEGVFETAAHSRFSNTSWLAIHCPDGVPETELFSRIKQECERFGVGLLVFQKPQDWDTYQNLLEAKRQIPDPEYTNEFISRQISKKNQDEIQELLK